MADLELELRWGEWGGRRVGSGFVLLALSAYLTYVISSFLTQNKGGTQAAPGPLPLMSD